jgi:hypothetical protein
MAIRASSLLSVTEFIRDSRRCVNNDRLARQPSRLPLRATLHAMTLKHAPER